MTRNDGGTPPGDLTRAAQVTETQNAIDPNDYWVRSSTQPDNYQFTGADAADKQVAAATQTKTDAPGTYTVTDKDSLWTIASKLVKDSDCQDKSDKFKLDVVKGLVEKNKDVKGLEANPDVIRGGQVLKIAPVEELAKLGHGKTLNTHYKPPSEREKSGEGSTPKDPNQKDPDCPPEHHRHHHGGRPAGYEDQQGFDPQNPNGQRPMDLGPVKDILGMFGAIAGGAFLGNRFGDHRWNGGPRGYYDGGQGYYDGGQGYYGGYGQNYYDGGNYGYYPNQFQQYRQYTNYNNPQQFINYQQPVDYSHYGRPVQNYVAPINQAQNLSQQYRIQQIQQQQQQRQQQWQLQQQPHHNFNQQMVQQQQRQQQIQQWQQQHRHA